MVKINLCPSYIHGHPFKGDFNYDNGTLSGLFSLGPVPSFGMFGNVCIILAHLASRCLFIDFPLPVLQLPHVCDSKQADLSWESLGCMAVLVTLEALWPFFYIRCWRSGCFIGWGCCRHICRRHTYIPQTWRTLLGLVVACSIPGLLQVLSISFVPLS